MENLKKQLYFDNILKEESKAIDVIKSDKKYFYKYVNRFKDSSRSPNLLVDEDNKTITDPQQISDLLQTQFKNVFSSPLSKSNLDDYDVCVPPITTPLFSSVISNNEIAFAI